MEERHAAEHRESPLSSPLLEMIDVEVRYGRSIVLQNASLRVEAGQWVALVGPNASGKSTLLRCAAGQLAPTRGSVRAQGALMYSRSAAARCLPGYAVQPEILPHFLSVRQCMQIYAEAHGLRAVPAASTALAEQLRLAAHFDTLVGGCSMGTRQKLAVVLALMTDPPLLLLDEVFNGLDAASALRLKAHLQECVQAGASIVLATHALDLVAGFCSHMVLLDAGRVVQQWDAQGLRVLGGAAGIEQALAGVVVAC
jgi:ABC-2 type transport system ATP-binding protein